mmetsp:Transcript_16887/g.49468  ORF Transcript_16887/g.49468 Transcript_16887/m.49468 type:complete len:247 (-) Transcript_16887:8-748(-)
MCLEINTGTCGPPSVLCLCDVTRVFLHGVTAARGGRHTRGGRATKQGENFTLHASLCGERVGEVHQRRLVAVEAEGGEQLVSLQRRVDVGRVDARLALLLDVAHRALQHLEVEVGPDLLGAEAALLRRAEERAGASQLEVGAREGVPRAEPRLSLEDSQPLERLGPQRRRVGVHHQRVRLHRGAPDAAAQLVQLREAEELRVLHDDRVDVGDVDPVLHDCGGHQHVRLAEREVDDPPLEVAQPACR